MWIAIAEAGAVTESMFESNEFFSDSVNGFRPQEESGFLALYTLS